MEVNAGIIKSRKIGLKESDLNEYPNASSLLLSPYRNINRLVLIALEQFLISVDFTPTSGEGVKALINFAEEKIKAPMLTSTKSKRATNVNPKSLANLSRSKSGKEAEPKQKRDEPVAKVETYVDNTFNEPVREDRVANTSVQNVEPIITEPFVEADYDSKVLTETIQSNQDNSPFIDPLELFRYKTALNK